MSRIVLGKDCNFNFNLISTDMFKAISDFFDRHLLLPTDENNDDRIQTLRLATAALLIEMTRADYEVKAVEEEKILQILKQRFDISDEDSRELVELAGLEADAVTSYHEFTSLINQHYSAEEKIEIVELLWAVAYADGEIEKYEDFLVRKIAELLYVPHREFIAAKHRVMENN